VHRPADALDALLHDVVGRADRHDLAARPVRLHPQLGDLRRILGQQRHQVRQPRVAADLAPRRMRQPRGEHDLTRARERRQARLLPGRADHHLVQRVQRRGIGSLPGELVPGGPPAQREQLGGVIGRPGGVQVNRGTVALARVQRAQESQLHAGLPVVSPPRPLGTPSGPA
jgi:hypothetical protein